MDIEGGTGGVLPGRDEPRRRTAHPAACHAKASAGAPEPWRQDLGWVAWAGGLMCCWFRLSEALAASGRATRQITHQNCPPGPVKPRKLGRK